MTCHSVKWVATIWELAQLGSSEEDDSWPEWIGNDYMVKTKPCDDVTAFQRSQVLFRHC